MPRDPRLAPAPRGDRNARRFPNRAQQPQRPPAATSHRRAGRGHGHGSTPGRVGLHRALRTGVHGHDPGVPRAAAGQPVAEDQLARRNRPCPQQPGARRRHRRPARDVREPVLRQDERPDLLATGHAATVDGDRPGRWFARRPRGCAGAQRRRRAGRMVHRPGVLQRAARRRGRRTAGSGPGRPTRSGLGRPGHLHADRLGGRDLPGPAVRRQPAHDVPGAVCDRRVLHPALRVRAERPTARQDRQATLVAAGVPQRVLRQPAQEPGLRVGVRQPLHVRPGLRLPDRRTRPTSCSRRSAPPRTTCRGRSSSAPSRSPR